MDAVEQANQQHLAALDALRAAGAREAEIAESTIADLADRLVEAEGTLATLRAQVDAERERGDRMYLELKRLREPTELERDERERLLAEQQLLSARIEVARERVQSLETELANTAAAHVQPGQLQLAVRTLELVHDVRLAELEGQLFEAEAARERKRQIASARRAQSVRTRTAEVSAKHNALIRYLRTCAYRGDRRLRVVFETDAHLMLSFEFFGFSLGGQITIASVARDKNIAYDVVQLYEIGCLTAEEYYRVNHRYPATHIQVVQGGYPACVNTYSEADRYIIERAIDEFERNGRQILHGRAQRG